MTVSVCIIHRRHVSEHRILSFEIINMSLPYIQADSYRLRTDEKESTTGLEVGGERDCDIMLLSDYYTVLCVGSAGFD